MLTDGVARRSGGPIPRQYDARCETVAEEDDDTSGRLVLKDGTVFHGESVGAEGEFVGEVVFNTSMTGYQEILYDPSYCGQMVVFTCPQIGNVGVNAADAESSRPHVRAVLARQIAEEPSSWRAEAPLGRWLAEYGIPALSGVDTRALTMALREQGVMRGALSTAPTSTERLLNIARAAPDMSTLTPVDEVTVGSPERWDAGLAPGWAPDTPLALDRTIGRAPHVVVLDCGAKQQILRWLASLGAQVTVVPAQLPAARILALQPDGVLISNGPGDPRQVPQAIDCARDLLGRVPLFGICLGHQIMALASGARVRKLPFGHHGGNHPVRVLDSGRVEITAQNHNYCVTEESLRGLPLEVTRVSLFDGTVEGLRHRYLPAWSVQYHPEASPGPHDACHELCEFVCVARGD